MDNSGPSIINLRPNKPDSCDGKRDFLYVSAWIYQVEQYLQLLQLSNTTCINDGTKVMVASTFFFGNAAVWWFTMIQGHAAALIWEEFENEIQKAFVQEDHVQRSRDKLWKLRQSALVSRFLAEFCNLVLIIPNMFEREKLARFRFVDWIKNKVLKSALRVLKSSSNAFEEAAQITLSVERNMIRKNETWISFTVKSIWFRLDTNVTQ